MQCSSDCSIINPGGSSACPESGFYIAKFNPARGGWEPHVGSPDQCAPGYEPAVFVPDPGGQEGVCKIFCCVLIPSSSGSGSGSGPT